MPLTRDPDWPHKLRLFTEAMRETEYAWGDADCCSNTCDWIWLSCSTDVYVDFRGKYSTEAEAYALIQSVTGTGNTVADAAAYVTAKFSMQEIAPAFAQRGDVVLHESAAGQMLGIVALNPSRAMFLTARGFIALPTRECAKAWRV